MQEEICEDCGGIITIFEQAFVYNGRIICEECDKKLRAPLEVRTEAAPVRPRDSLLTGRERPQETQELETGPVEVKQTADVSNVHTPKPLPHKRKRVSTTESTLLPLSLAGWSLLCLFLIFYVPGRYMSMLNIKTFDNEYQTVRFSVECLILFFMVLWFFGALGLFIVTTITQKDEKLDNTLRILKLLGF